MKVLKNRKVKRYDIDFGWYTDILPSFDLEYVQRCRRVVEYKRNKYRRKAFEEKKGTCLMKW